MFTTKSKFTVNGEYFRERVALHDSIVSSLIKGEPKTSPSSFLVGGGTASGKSWATELVIEAYRDENEEVTLINCDKIKEVLPEYQELVLSDPENVAEILHDESSDISERIIDLCILENRSFIYDGTMKNLDKYSKLISRLKEKKYTVNAYLVDVPVEIALVRNELRFLEEKRRVPDDILINSHKMFVKTFLILRKEFNAYRLFDTSGENPEIIAEKDEGNPEAIFNIDKFIAFCLKSKDV